MEEIQNKISKNKAAIIFEYNSLINALPNEWKEWINRKDQHTENNFNYPEANLYDGKSNYIRKVLKNKAENKAARVNAADFWQRKLGISLDTNTWLIPKHATKEVRLKELQWKILHNIYPTNILQHKMKVVESNKCNNCPEHVDYIEHTTIHDL